MSEAPERPERVVAVLEAATAWLERRGVDAPRRSVELLMQHVLGVDRLHLYLAHDRPLDTAERDRLRGLVARRGQHEPVAHLLGSWEFHGHELAIDGNVLIPRPETEGLVDLALERLGAGPRRIADLGTGSGAIAIAVAHARPDATVVAVDVSEAALEIAARNVATHALAERVALVLGSWWEPLAGVEPFDLVIANPPYVDPARPELCADDVRRYEPGVALWTPPGHPGAAYEAIAAGLRRHLVPGGTVALETGIGADRAALEALQRTPGLGEVELRDDLEGRPRYLLARRL